MSRVNQSNTSDSVLASCFALGLGAAVGVFAAPAVAIPLLVFLNRRLARGGR